VLANHDAFFGENLMALADPASFDFGTAIVTRITAQGTVFSDAFLVVPDPF